MTSEDTHDIKELDEEVSVYSPKQHIVRVWNMFISISCLAAVTVSLYELFVNSTVQGVIFLRYGLDVVFIFNIISRFHIGYESHGVVIIDPKRVRKKYLMTWFLLDLLSVVPLETFKTTFRELKFLHVNRCLRVFRLFGIITSFSKEPDTNKVHVTALNCFSIAVLCIQTSACIWFKEACDGAYDGHARYCPKEENWLQLLPEYSSNLTAVTDMEFYATSLYWSAITLCAIGFGDIHATNLEEVTVASFVMVVGLLAVSGIIMTSMSSIISNMDAQRGRFYHRMETVHHYVTHMGLPEEIQTWVHTYYYYLWTHQKGRVITGLMDDLPFVLHSDISSCCYKPLLKKAKLFRETQDGFKRALSVKCHTYTYSPGQILVKAGEVYQNLYYIKHGRVQVLGENSSDEIATLLPGSLFGEVHLLYKIPRNATVYVSTLCEICILGHKDLLSLFTDYPEAGVKIARAAKTRVENFKYPLREAFAYGLASHPQNVVFDKDLRSDFQSFWKRTVHPGSAFIKNWEAFFFWCITVSVFLETWVVFFTNNVYTVGLYSEGWGALYLAVGGLIDFVAAFDILVNLRTEVVTEDGYVTDFTVIFQTYRKSWNLYYDVLAVLPLDFISFAYDGAEHWKILSLLRLNRLIWLRRIYLYFYKRESDIYANLFVQRTAKCLFLLIFSVHFCAGLLYLSACFEFKCHEESWAWNAGLDSNQSNFYHYMYAAYWTTTVMTSLGYGDIIPGSLIERCLAVLVGFIGVLIFNYIIGQVFATVSGENAIRVTFQNLLSAMRDFMERHNLTVSQQNRVMEYMNLLWSKYQGEAYPGGPFLMRDLPVELKQTVLMAERGELLSKIPYFEEAGLSFIQDLASTSVVYFFPKGEIIQYSNTITRELFCIREGTCQILNDDLSEIVGRYRKGMYFGEAGFLFGKQATLTVRAMTCCEILVLDFDKVRVVLEKYPVLKGQIEELQANSECYKALVDTVEKKMKRQCKVQDETEGVQKKKKVPLTFQGRRYSKKSKCYVEDFGNIPIYAGSEEETVAEKVQKLQKKRLGARRPKRAILPSNSLYVRWEFFRTMLAVAVSVISSLLFAFLHYKMELWIVCYVLGLLCWIDMYIRMHVAFYKSNDLQVDTLETAHHYVKNGFLVDFITCFPWELVGWMMVSPFSENGFYGNASALHLYAYLRIPHIFQLYRVPLAFSFMQADIGAEKNIITFVKLLLYCTLFIHFITCIVFASVCPVGDLHGDNKNYLLPVTKHNCTPLSWVKRLDRSFNVDFDTVTFSKLYIVSFYFATTTICGVGFGDIHPSVTSMKIGMILIMIAGTLFCGWLSGTITAMLANADAMRAAYTERTESMKLFLKSHEITGALYDSIIGFYTFRWIRTKGIDQDKLFEYLPSSLVGDISTVLYADFIAKVFGLNIQRKNENESVMHRLTPLEIRKAGKLNGSFFETMLTKENMEQLETDGCFIRLLARRIRPCLYRASDLIYKKNDYGSEMYFIEKGEVDVLSKDELTVVVKLKAGQYFGERSLLLGEPRTSTIRAATNCDLYVLSKKSLDETFRYYPCIYKQIQRAADLMKDQLHQEDHDIRTFRKPETAEDILLRDGGYLKLYRDCMAEEVHRAEQNARPLHIRLWTAVQGMFTMIFNTVNKIHNKTIDPENTFRVVYQYTSCLLIVILFWALTYMSSVYDVDWYIFLLTMIVEFIQMIEIILKFHICYYDESGTYISDYKSTSQNYMKRKIGYVFDLVCSFPYGLLVLHQMYTIEPATFLPMIIYARMAHLPRIITLLVFMRKEEQSITTNLLCIRIIKYLVHAVLFIHCAAVLWISFVKMYGLMSWVGETEIYSFPEMYRYATYLVLQIYTTTGYGDIKAANLEEIIVFVMLMILAKIQVNYKMGLLTSTQTNKRALQVAYEEKLETIQTYMIDKKIPSALQKRVMQFYNYRWNRTNGTDAEVLFKDIPHCLKMEILSRICIKLLRKHQLFSHLPEPFLRELSTRMLIRCFPVGEYIYRKGDTGTGMFLILIGKVKLCPDTRGTKIIERLSAGAAFGDQFLLKRALYRDTAIAENYVDIAILSKDSFEDVGLLYPTVMSKLLKTAADILKL
ncbi:uncharacterized protein LOC127428788 [Myxocyprinus asiaticus]|uniref:uncharacterized protein LOC127428788 n=1 Tax=Myxocyprinus asiaticus TaxID=70543 RepID=UPI002222AB23|nr:uncharacterized protein LOC127428788 [Myxocyprinus asiaticus]